MRLDPGFCISSSRNIIAAGTRSATRLAYSLTGSVVSRSYCLLGTSGRQISDAVLDTLFGPAETFEYVSTTTPG